MFVQYKVERGLYCTGPEPQVLIAGSTRFLFTISKISVQKFPQKTHVLNANDPACF